MERQHELKTLEIDWSENGKVEKRKVVIRKLFLGEKGRLKSEIFKPVRIEGRIELLPDLKEMEVLPIFHCVVEAPWKVNDYETVLMLDESVANQILPAIMEFNGMVEDQKKNLSTPSSTGLSTPQ